jgi:hypothetical protein
MARIPVARRSARLERLLREGAGEDAVRLAQPLAALLANTSWADAAVLETHAVARDRAVPWPTRRVAALMLETWLARTAESDAAWQRFWLQLLGLSEHPAAELQREGYDPRQPFFPQLFRRVRRFARVHRLADSAKRSDRALHDYLRAARRDCRLTLARYLFSADEVIGRIEHDLRRSTGQRDPAKRGQFLPEAQRAIESLPSLERTIVEHLGRDAVIRWAAPSTSGAINSLVEQPAGTVVVTIKPPGSSHEIEIKRAGRTRELPLDVVWARDNYILPSSHHLDGGSMHHLLAYEAENSAFFSRVFREVHGTDAAMSRTLFLATIFAVATPGGEADLLDYFTSRRVYGPRFDSMRSHLRHVVKTLADHAGDDPEIPVNDLAVTVDFIGRVKPAQAIQIGTTSFRLDRLARYLSAGGADRYFRRKEHDPDEARAFADELLDEILCEYEPPQVPWRSHEQYVTAAFEMPANRVRANRRYVAAMEQIGRFWGTLLALRGHSEGESFVGRNAGLRSVWCDGEWQIRVVFMDHDSLSFSSLGVNTYRPHNSVRNAAKDGKHILGGRYGKVRVRGELSFLREIYRAGPGLERRGVAAFRAAMKSAYDRTHDAIRTNPELTRLFRAPFVERIRDWDDLVTSYLRTPRSRAARNSWKSQSRSLLVQRGYRDDVADEHVATVTRQARFLRRIAFLF